MTAVKLRPQVFATLAIYFFVGSYPKSELH